MKKLIQSMLYALLLCTMDSVFVKTMDEINVSAQQGNEADLAKEQEQKSSWDNRGPLERLYHWLHRSFSNKETVRQALQGNADAMTELKDQANSFPPEDSRSNATKETLQKITIKELAQQHNAILKNNKESTKASDLRILSKNALQLLKNLNISHAAINISINGNKVNVATGHHVLLTYDGKTGDDITVNPLARTPESINHDQDINFERTYNHVIAQPANAPARTQDQTSTTQPIAPILRQQQGSVEALQQEARFTDSRGITPVNQPRSRSIQPQQPQDEFLYLQDLGVPEDTIHSTFLKGLDSASKEYLKTTVDHFTIPEMKKEFVETLVALAQERNNQGIPTREIIDKAFAETRINIATGDTYGNRPAAPAVSRSLEPEKPLNQKEFQTALLGLEIPQENIKSILSMNLDSNSMQLLIDQVKKFETPLMKRNFTSKFVTLASEKNNTPKNIQESIDDADLETRTEALIEKENRDKIAKAAEDERAKKAKQKAYFETAHAFISGGKPSTPATPSTESEFVDENPQQQSGNSLFGSPSNTSPRASNFEELLDKFSAK